MTRIGREFKPTTDPTIAGKKLRLKLESLPEQDMPAIEGSIVAVGRRFAIVVSRFNAFITERLLLSAVDGLVRSGATKDGIDVVRVPGAFEIPLAARKLAETGKYDAVICIGCLLRGDTAHYDVIVNEVTRGIGQSAQETGVPHAFGVLTCENLEQAIDRAGLKMGNKGFEAALAAVEMASLKEAIGGRAADGGRQQSGGGHLSSAVGEQQIPRSARNDKSNLRNDKADLRNGKSKKKLRLAKIKRK
jgi:6,7-dimethyl-8-ribityllumazine synthase